MKKIIKKKYTVFSPKEAGEKIKKCDRGKLDVDGRASIGYGNSQDTIL